MRKSLVVVMSGGLLLAALAAPPLALGATTSVNCRSGADLQAAVNTAMPGDTLSISGTCTGNFVVAKDLTLKGRGLIATLNAGGSGSALALPYQVLPLPSFTVTLIGLRITGGDRGLEVGERASVILTRSWVAGNPGGGITLAPRSSVDLQDSWVWGNGGTGVSIEGPGGHLQMKHSTISDNAANGITVVMQGGVWLDDSTVSRNGGIGISNTNASLNLNHSTVRGNAGGGIYGGDLSHVHISHSVVADNTATSSGGGVSIVRSFVPLEGTLDIEDSTIRNNSAGVSGGGLYIAGGWSTLRNVTFTNNTAGSSGGGIFNEGLGPLTLTGITYRHNAPNNCTGC